MKKSVGILTYHGLHNYGAMLQAFALQKIIQSLEYHCEIINFRTKIQKQRYRKVFRPGCSPFEGLVKMLLWAPIKSDIFKKHELFESFMKNQLDLSNKSYETLEDLNQIPPNYDYYITGSDQVWNPYGPSFNWAYYLPFVNNGGKRISYAPSMGQTKAQNIEIKLKNRINSYLQKFDNISVRENIAAENIEIITGESPPVVLDPTLLFNKNQWEKYIKKEPIISGEYIFYYSPYYNKNALRITREIAKRLDLKVICSIAHSASFMIKYPDFKKVTAIGPLEFLNLCNNAKLICGHSLHQVALSIALQKPFFIIDGLLNVRTNHLLNITGLYDRNISNTEFNNKLNDALNIDYNEVNKILDNHRKISINYLIKSLQW